MASQQFEIDPGFSALCIRLGRFARSHLLLMNNAALPWFILIPETREVELCDLDIVSHNQIFDEVRIMSQFVQRHFSIDKLNVACNGNVIRQMHLHVVGRRFDDYCWPGVVWGVEPPGKYEDSAIAQISDLLHNDRTLTNFGYLNG